MRFMIMIFLALFFTVQLSAIEEIDRIDSIVSDIEKLRKEYKIKLAEEREKNSTLVNRIHELQVEITSLKIQIKKLKKAKKPKKKVHSKRKHKKQSLYHFKASAFHLSKNANIYADKSTNRVIEKWEKGTSFTSNLKSDKRIKITGYFVNKVWKKADKNMWVNLIDVESKKRQR